MSKKFALLPVFLTVCLVAYSQEFEQEYYGGAEAEAGNGQGFAAQAETVEIPLIAPERGRGMGSVNVTLDVRLNVAEFDRVEFSDEAIRAPRSSFINNSYLTVGPMDGNWFTEDSVIRFSYATENFGGSMVLRPADFGVPPWSAWFNIGPMFRITAGSDIESIYADPQGANPGLRVYTGVGGRTGWDGYFNPDNITQDRGLLLEGFFGPVTIALTGMSLETEGNAAVITDGIGTFLMSENRRLQLGGRIGSKIGRWGSVNASYFVLYERVGGSYRIIGEELFPVASISEVYNHHFGVFASLTPLANLGVTVGYGGLLTRLLDEFWDRATGVRQETEQPVVMRNAFMLNAQYTDIIPRLTLRTDHNFTFWTDKDMRSLAINIPGWLDFGPMAVVPGLQRAEVSHFILWNGIGASYQLTDMLGLDLYVRNLHRRTHSEGLGGEIFTLTRNEFFIEPKLFIDFGLALGNLGATVRFEFGLSITNTTTAASEDLNFEGRNLFAPIGGSNRRHLGTRDSQFNIQVPIGVTMQF